VELGLQIPNFTWPGGAPAIATTLAQIAREAEAAGFTRFSVMDHLWI
jgi:alkanesulfonate monooxygenase SsuD/methylene tetrahydromethanopterin reductase-like flavin-dependent oxidoreductase (luciferase family)